MMKRILSTSLALTLALSLMTGCVPKNTTSADVTRGSNGGVITRDRTTGSGTTNNNGVLPNDGVVNNNGVLPNGGTTNNNTATELTPGRNAAVR